MSNQNISLTRSKRKRKFPTNTIIDEMCSATDRRAAVNIWLRSRGFEEAAPNASICEIWNHVVQCISPGSPKVPSDKAQSAFMYFLRGVMLGESAREIERLKRENDALKILIEELKKRIA